MPNKKARRKQALQAKKVIIQIQTRPEASQASIRNPDLIMENIQEALLNQCGSKYEEECEGYKGPFEQHVKAFFDKNFGCVTKNTRPIDVWRYFSGAHRFSASLKKKIFDTLLEFGMTRNELTKCLNHAVREFHCDEVKILLATEMSGKIQMDHQEALLRMIHERYTYPHTLSLFQQLLRLCSDDELNNSVTVDVKGQPFLTTPLCWAILKYRWELVELFVEPEIAPGNGCGCLVNHKSSEAFHTRQINTLLYTAMELIEYQMHNNIYNQDPASRATVENAFVSMYQVMIRSGEYKAQLIDALKSMLPSYPIVLFPVISSYCIDV